MHSSYLKSLLLTLLPILCFSQNNFFLGPFPSWTNLKTHYGAFGDGQHDDTRALQTALNDLGQNGHGPVLYIPDGTYRITAPLTMQTRMDIAIIGEDPQKTIIFWDGVSGSRMFQLNGVSYSEYRRLTWDGNHKALVAYAHEWDSKVRYANSGSLHEDEIFKNLVMGIKSGPYMDAECTILRCRFLNCSGSGIFLGGFNALDWWIWDCYFDSCHVGVSNMHPNNGAGNFHVYRSIFKHSGYADISIGNSEFYSFRDNISFLSNCFIYAEQYSNTSPITIQGNTIYHNRNFLMVNLFTKGNILMLDNRFIEPDSGKNYAIDLSDNYQTSPPDAVFIGNSFTRTKKVYLVTDGRFIDLQNKTGVPYAPIAEPGPKPFAVTPDYPVFELDPRMNAAGIQKLINHADSTGKPAILHFRYGNYSINQTIVIPAGSPLILCGDGLSSILTWSGAAGGTLIRMESPARCSFQNLHLLGSSRADGIRVEDCDLPGNSIYGNEVMLYRGLKTNLLVNGISKTAIRFDDFQHNYCDTGTSVKLIGTDDPKASLLRVFGGESSNKGNSYGLYRNARLLLYDTWYENPLTLPFMKLRGKGEFVLNGGKIASNNGSHDRFIDIDSFSGKVTLSEIIFYDPKKTLYFNDRIGSASFLAIGNLNWADSTNGFFDLHSKKTQFSTINNRQNTGRGSYRIPNLGNSSSQFVLSMIQTIRQTRVSDHTPTPGKNNSHLTLDRLMIEGCINNLIIEKTGASQSDL